MKGSVAIELKESEPQECINSLILETVGQQFLNEIWEISITLLTWLNLASLLSWSSVDNFRLQRLQKETLSLSKNSVKGD